MAGRTTPKYRRQPTYKLNTNDLTGIRTVLREYNGGLFFPSKYVYLDLSGSAITTIPDSVFYECGNLESVTIPNSVKSIRDAAFWGCHSLVSVTFQGTIPSSGFSNDPRYLSFPGDLCNKFYATDPVNGTPGTYTRPDGKSETWTKQ